jgi:hypothetical protein
MGLNLQLTPSRKMGTVDVEWMWSPFFWNEGTGIFFFEIAVVDFLVSHE